MCLLTAQAAISRLNTMAAIIGVQDSLQHVQPQLWFLQSLLGKLTLIVHSLAGRALRLISKQGRSPMLPYLAGESHYCSINFVQPGGRNMPLWHSSGCRLVQCITRLDSGLRRNLLQCTIQFVRGLTSR